MPLDFAQIMGASQDLVPDFRVQTMQDQAFRQQQAANNFGQMIKQQNYAREQAFRQRLTSAVASGDPAQIHALMVEFPEFADQLKAGVGAMDEQTKQTNLTQMGTVYARAQAGDYTGAADAIDKRIAADKAAGLDSSDDEQLSAALRSGDPTKQKIALTTIGVSLAAITGPDKFGDTYGKLNPTDKQTNVQKEYDWRVQQFGKDQADKWLATQDLKLVPVQQGGSVYNGADFVSGQTAPTATAPTQTGGGDPASTGYVMPVKGGTFGDGLGASRDGGARRHNGLDIDAPLGSPVIPVAAGTITQIGHDPRSGTFVKVRHADGTSSSYSHLGSVNVREGDSIAPGQSLGTVGTSGNATGPVLHLVMRDASGKLLDPRRELGSKHGSVTDSKIIDGKRYFQIGGKWFDNPRGQ